eukprot:859631-Prymnesium_polylepis.1
MIGACRRGRDRCCSATSRLFCAPKPEAIKRPSTRVVCGPAGEAAARGGLLGAVCGPCDARDRPLPSQVGCGCVHLPPGEARWPAGW